MSVHELGCFTFLLFCDTGGTTSVRNGGAFNDCNNRNHHFQSKSESQITISNPNHRSLFSIPFPNRRSIFSIQIANYHLQSESQITIFNPNHRSPFFQFLSNNNIVQSPCTAKYQSHKNQKCHTCGKTTAN